MNDRLEVEQFAALLEAHAAERGEDAAGHRSGDGATRVAGARGGAVAGGAGGLVALAERVTVIGQIAEQSVPGPSVVFREALRARLVAEAPTAVAAGAGAGSRRSRARVPAQRAGRGGRTGARHSAETKTGVFTGISASWRRRLLAAGVGVAVATGSVGGIALASAGAEPGDPLYNAKKVFESLQLSLSGSPTDQGREYLHLADIRLGEIDVLLDRPDVDMSGSPTQAYLNQTLGELRTMIQNGGDLLVQQVQQHGDQTALHALADFLLTERQRVADLSWQLPPDLGAQPAQIVTLMDNLASELQVAAQQAAAKQSQGGTGVGQQGGTGQQGQNGGGPSGAQTGAANPTSADTATATGSASSSAEGAAGSSTGASTEPSTSSSASPSASSPPTIGITVPVPVLPSIGVTVPSILGLPEIVVELGGDGESSASATPTG
jgi:Domain of unknown function (DUF5667)